MPAVASRLVDGAVRGSKVGVGEDRSWRRVVLLVEARDLEDLEDGDLLGRPGAVAPKDPLHVDPRDLLDVPARVAEGGERLKATDHSASRDAGVGPERLEADGLDGLRDLPADLPPVVAVDDLAEVVRAESDSCLLYTSDAADDTR